MSPVIALPCVLLVALSAPALGQAHLLPQPAFDLVAGELSGERAQENTRHIVQHHRIQGSPMMAEVAHKVVLAGLRAAGIEASIESFPSDGKLRYQTMTSPIGWSIRQGELWVEGAGEPGFVPYRLCRYDDVPMCVSSYSRGGEWRGELIEVGRGTAERDFAGREVRGKVVLASGYAAAVVRQAVIARGAVGAVIYPDAGDRPEHPDMVRYNGLWTRADEVSRSSGSFQISRRQYERLRALMQEGPVRVRGRIDATLGPGALTLVHAYLRGAAEPGREVLLTAHLDHPRWSANDNASGAGALLEVARTLHALIAAKKVPPPRRTLHFMWVPEFNGTMAYVTAHPEARRCGAWDDPRPAPRGAPGRCIVASLNLDMVGEDTVKTQSRFYLTRTPGSVPGPPFLDALLADVLEQTREAGLIAPTGTRNYWPAELVPYAQGSDHDVLLGLGVPASMLGHAPDWTHHTSEDTLDKTDPSELLRVGVLAGAAALFLGRAEDADLRRLAARALGARVAAQGERLGQVLGAQGPGLPGVAGLLQRQLGEDVAALRAAPEGRDLLAPGARSGAAAPPAGGEATAPRARGGPRRLMLLPFEDVFEPAGLDPEQRRWHEAQRARFADDRAAGPSFDVLAYEAVNFMDGRRSAADIALLLSTEFLLPVDAAWVGRLVQILAVRRLVQP